MLTTPSGVTLAKLMPVSDGPGKTRFQYRTAKVSPMSATARRQARAIRAALDDYVV